jgi:undecaprenyl-diphosphatase
LKYIFLALLQGLTEFLPVSSSGHLVFYQKIFDFQEPLLLFDIILHLATALSVIVFLKKDLAVIIFDSIKGCQKIVSGEKFKTVFKMNGGFRLAVLVLLAMVPSIIFGLLLNEFADKLFGSLKVISVTFLINGGILFATKIISQGKRDKINLKDALFIGIMQAIAIFPGISRSGSTIACGIFRGLDKNSAARFSFILSVPTILAAAIFKLKDGLGAINVGFITLSFSFLVAFISGYFSLIVLSKMIARAKFHYFAYYCWLMGIISLVLFLKTL